MAFEWKDYLQLAEELLLRGDEASLRSCISRAYYSAFCRARDDAGLDRQSYNIHQAVIETYELSSDREDRKIGRLLSEIKPRRIDADYRAEAVIHPATAERVVLKSQQIHRLLDERG